MPGPTIICPVCRAAIPLTESLAAPLLAAERTAIAAREAEVARAREGLGAAVAAQVEAERRRLTLEAQAAARDAAAAEVAELRDTLVARDAKLAEAQAAQAEALRATRALADARRELDLTVEKRIGEGLGAARIEVEAAMKLKVSEKEQVIAAMQRQIEELRRRAEQGSQQLQGDVLELDIEAQLRARFPFDAVERVAKGALGADVLHRVVGPAGEACGAILWESKRTKAWSEGWIAKLKGDQRAAGAELALLVSEALPRGVETFDVIDGVWIASHRCALPLAGALRQGLIGASAARLARDGQATKMEQVYDYLTGPRFRHRIEAIVEKFTAMEKDLRDERRLMTKQWAKREMQIAGVLDATVGLYGDLQGIGGRAFEEIEGLELPLLDAPNVRGSGDAG